ncbi:MAG: glycosyltransferase [Flavobacteriaceae bacterium]|jgi:glycosyltransferase involved in cell wall biosynthesis|nr:glycosyltransferase [Flavobacteriaceae bacterium]
MNHEPKKIKILFRHRSMEMGGVEKVLLSLLHNLDRNKFEMTVCLNINQGELRDEFPKHVRKVFLAAGKEDFSKNPIIRKIQLIKRKFKLLNIEKNPQIADRILNEKYDVEIAMTYGDFPMVANSTNKNSKKIGWLHSDLSMPGFAPIRENIFKAMQGFDFMIYGSRQCKNVLDEKFPNLKLPAGKVILNAIPIEELKQKSKEFPVDFGETPTFVSVGRLHYRKGQKTLLEVHKKLLDAGFAHNIVVIGDGEDYAFLEKRIKELGVKNSFKLLGTKINPYPYILNADFFVMPSESEGWPLIVAETLILQKPIVATKVGGIPELIEHKKTGLLVEYSIESLFSGMKELLTNENLVSNLQENLKNIENQFDNQKKFDAVEQVILDLTT